MKLSRQGYWSGVPFPSPGDLPDPGVKPGSPALQTGALPSEPPGKPKKKKKKIKYLGINLPKETKELYIENYKTLMKEIKDNINRWRDIPCSWVGRISIVKMIILPNAIYRVSVIPIKLPMAFFTELEQKNFTIHMETQKTPNSHTVLRNKNAAGRINLPEFRLYCKL